MQLPNEDQVKPIEGRQEAKELKANKAGNTFKIKLENNQNLRNS